MNPLIIFVEGNIGCGKSTFLNQIKDHIPNVQCIQEPLDKWTKLCDRSGKNILQYFYDDMKKYTYPFQSFAFLSRVMLLDKIDKTKQIVFIERSVFSDKNIFAKNCLDNGTMTEIEWNLYNVWFDWMINKLNISNYKTIYLKCDPETSYKRLQERNRKEEQNVSLQYIQDIHRCHEEWLNKDNSITVDATRSFKDNIEFLKIYNELLQQLIKQHEKNNSQIDIKNIKEIMHC